MDGAFAWGILAASSLVIGALVALRFHLSLRVIGLIMGFGAGVLISAASFDLIDEAADKASGSGSVAVGVFAGCLVFFGGDWLIERFGGRGAQGRDRRSRRRLQGGITDDRRPAVNACRQGPVAKVSWLSPGFGSEALAQRSLPLASASMIPAASTANSCLAATTAWSRVAARSRSGSRSVRVAMLLASMPGSIGMGLPLGPVAELANPVNRPGEPHPGVPIRPNSPTVSSCGLRLGPVTATTGTSPASIRLWGRRSSAGRDPIRVMPQE